MVVGAIVAGAAVLAGTAYSIYSRQQQQEAASRQAASAFAPGPRIRPQDPPPQAPKQTPEIPQGVFAPAAAAPPPGTPLPTTQPSGGTPPAASSSMMGISGPDVPPAPESVFAPTKTDPKSGASSNWLSNALPAAAGLGAVGGLAAAAHFSNPRPDKTGGYVPGYRGIEGGGYMNEQERLLALRNFISRYNDATAR